MKITQISFFIISILFFGCTNINKENSTTLTLNDVQKIISKDTVIDHNFILDSRMKSQIDLYEYIFSKYVRPSIFNFHTYFYVEDFYNSKLFNRLFEVEISNSEVIIKNDYSPFTLMETTQYDDSKYEIPYRYIYNNKGSLVKVLCQEDQYYRKELKYNKDGLLVKITNYTKTPRMVGKSENRVEYSGGDKVQEIVSFNYTNNLLTNRSFRRTTDLWGEGWNQEISYYTDQNKPFKKYIIKKTKGILYGIEIICFVNSEIEYVIFKTGSVSSILQHDNVKEVYRVSTYRSGDKSDFTIEFFQNRDSTFYELQRTFKIRLDNEYRHNKEYKIEKVYEIFYYSNMGGVKSIETTYRYIYDHDRLVGYGIYEYREPRIKEDGEQIEKEYTLTRGFQLLSK